MGSTRRWPVASVRRQPAWPRSAPGCWWETVDVGRAAAGLVATPAGPEEQVAVGVPVVSGAASARPNRLNSYHSTSSHLSVALASLRGVEDGAGLHWLLFPTTICRGPFPRRLARRRQTTCRTARCRRVVGGITALAHPVYRFCDCSQQQVWLSETSDRGGSLWRS